MTKDDLNSQAEGAAFAEEIKESIREATSKAPVTVQWWVGFFASLAGYMCGDIGRDAMWITEETARATKQTYEIFDKVNSEK